MSNVDILCMNVSVHACWHGLFNERYIDMLEMLCMLNSAQITHGSMLTIINSPYYYGGFIIVNIDPCTK